MCDADPYRPYDPPLRVVLQLTTTAGTWEADSFKQLLETTRWRTLTAGQARVQIDSIEQCKVEPTT